MRRWRVWCVPKRLTEKTIHLSSRSTCMSHYRFLRMPDRPRGGAARRTVLLNALSALKEQHLRMRKRQGAWCLGSCDAPWSPRSLTCKPVLFPLRQAVPAAPEDARQGADHQRHWAVVRELHSRLCSACIIASVAGLYSCLGSYAIHCGCQLRH